MRSASSSSATWNEKSGVSLPSIRALVTCGAKAVNSGSAMALMMSMACFALATDSRRGSCAILWNSPTARCSRSTRWMDSPDMSRQPNSCAVLWSNVTSESSGSSWLPAGEKRLSRRLSAASTGFNAPRPSTSISASNMRYVPVGSDSPHSPNRSMNSPLVKVTVTRLRTVGFLRSWLNGSSPSPSKSL